MTSKSVQQPKQIMFKCRVALTKLDDAATIYNQDRLNNKGSNFIYSQTVLKTVDNLEDNKVNRTTEYQLLH